MCLFACVVCLFAYASLFVCVFVYMHVLILCLYTCVFLSFFVSVLFCFVFVFVFVLFCLFVGGQRDERRKWIQCFNGEFNVVEMFSLTVIGDYRTRR